jgi:hypothetical protein
LDAATIERVGNMTLNEKPPGGTHWSLRKMAKAVGLSPGRLTLGDPSQPPSLRPSVLPP